MGGKYGSYLELRDMEQEGRDYRIRFSNQGATIAVMAPHGGDIEPGTTEIAEAVARDRHAFYSFEGMKPDHNLDLHIASTCFDEPAGVEIASSAARVITIHGCREREPAVVVGGLDTELRDSVKASLEKAGFSVREDPRLPGRSRMNICNRCSRGRGVQLEVTRGLRMLLFTGLRASERTSTRPLFSLFVGALREVLQDYVEPSDAFSAPGCST